MKKNKMMRIASILMVAVLVSTCAVSGTFAKYVTSDSGKDTARVAKWGVSILASGDLFAETYKKAADNTPNKENGAARTGLSVVASTAVNGDNVTLDNVDKVVAPGTKNTDGLLYTVAGTPEVDGKLDLVVKGINKADDTLENFDAKKHDIFLAKNTDGYGVMVYYGKTTSTIFEADKYYVFADNKYSKAVVGDWGSEKDLYVLHDAVTTDEDYFPMVYSINGTAVFADKQKTSSLNTIVSQLSAMGSIAFEDNTNLNTLNKDASFDANGDGTPDTVKLVDTGKVKLTWEWTFDHTTDGSGSFDFDPEDNPDVKPNYRDGADTILGNLAAGQTTAGTQAPCVVKKSGESYVVLVDGTDYNLTTAISIALTATQVD